MTIDIFTPPIHSTRFSGIFLFICLAAHLFRAVPENVDASALTDASQWNAFAHPIHRDVPPTSTLKRAVLLGDSNMFRLVWTIAKQRNVRPVVQRDGCELPFVIIRHDFTYPPRVQGIGPCKRERVGCTDCGGCNSTRMLFEASDGVTWDVLFVPFEFARDISRQSALHNTTQEVVVNELFKAFPPDKVMLSLGTHDTCALSCDGVPPSECVDGNAHQLLLYEHNLRWLRSLLDPFDTTFFAAFPPCKEFQPEAYRGITNSKLIFELDKVASEVFRGQFIDTFAVIDRLGHCTETHADGVHLQHWVYVEHVLPLINKYVFGDTA